MGVDSTIDENDFGDELNSKGFLLANFDKLITWAERVPTHSKSFGLRYFATSKENKKKKCI